jgi:hypothetical protein
MKAFGLLTVGAPLCGEQFRFSSIRLCLLLHEGGTDRR